MIIRDYEEQDETGWVRCRVISFLDCSYFDDIRREKETYEKPSICLVAEENGTIVGFIDVEYEESIGDVCYLKGGIGATIWHLGVLPEYRHLGVATRLLESIKERLLQIGINRIEVWTQDDELSNRWYIKQGFVMKEAYLNAYIKGLKEDDVIKKYLNLDSVGDIYGIRNINFEAPIERKSELLPLCYRLHEVRVYELAL
ncbi:GNAT family N-acetyltransferase [Paenibacillus sp. FSL K6-2524]|uniref:GNAT family N-acetyltransferase n=1 Tax=Paenibacillus sp. FSL K6-2524 TaxID=2954516 RepID=UPI0030F692F8